MSQANSMRSTPHQKWNASAQASKAEPSSCMLENRLCVAMSRQKRLLVVVGDSEMLKGEQAAQVVPGLVKFYQLCCGGDHGVKIHA